jgi:peptidoglycan/xylan/chitin deacetylase (PgdA/CDA1 family)
MVTVILTQIALFLLIRLSGYFVSFVPDPDRFGPAAPEMCRVRLDKRIAITFDADMTAGMQQLLAAGRVTGWYNRELIRFLDEHRVPATLFLAGMWTEVYPKEAWILAQNPLFEIANHSYSHPGFAQPCYGLEKVNDAQKKYELYHSKAVIKAATGVDTTLFRFPGGCQRADDINLVHSMGMQVVGWDIVSGDAFSHNIKTIVNNVLQNAHDGGIIVAHMNAGPNAPRTADAVSEIVPALRARGYRFVKVSEMLPKGTLVACR